MKKFFTLLTFSAFALTLNAQIYFEDDFEGGTLTANNAWHSEAVANPDAINGNWVLGTVSGNYAKQGNYVSGAYHTLDSWFISPVIDLSSATQPVMHFRNTRKFAGDPIKVWISTDYSGTGAPSGATWTDISSIFWLDTAISGYIFVNSGDGDLTSYITGSPSTVYIAFEYIGSNTDGSTWEVDDVMIQEGPTVVTVTTIYDIQYTTAGSGDSPEVGNVVTTAGIVTGIFQIGSDADRFFIQDGDGAWNGIYVYENGYTVALGDSVLVTGEVLEFNGLTEIGFVSDVTIVSSGNAQPNPASVTGQTVNDEEWEGVLVTLQDGICSAVTDAFGVWQVTASGGVNVKIDDDLLPASFTAVLGDGYDVTGVRHYSFGETKIYPRSSAEIVTVGYASVEENASDLIIYPNPASENVVINASADAVVAIYAVNGTLVVNGVANKTIDVSGLEAGVYQVVITENGTQSSHKLVIR